MRQFKLLAAMLVLLFGMAPQVSFAAVGYFTKVADAYDPQGVAADAAGNLYIVNSRNGLRVDAVSGAVSTLGLPGGSVFAGVAADAAGNLYFAGRNRAHVLYKVDTLTGALSTQATILANTDAVTADRAGNLYFALSASGTILRMDAVTGAITTVAGGGTGGDGVAATAASLNWPDAIALDDAGNLYIAEFYGHRIRKVDAVSGLISTVAGTGVAGFSGDGGPATSAQLNGPRGIVIDSAGNLFIADYHNGRIRKVDATGTMTTVAGNGGVGGIVVNVPATSANLNVPVGLCIDGDGNLYMASFNGVYKVEGIAARRSPVASWQFDEGSGTTAVDSSGHGYSGSIQGASYTAGLFNNALSFDGVSSNVAFGAGPSVTGKGPFAVSAWVKTTDADGVILQQRGAQYNGEYILSVGGLFTANPGKACIEEYGDNQYGFDVCSTTAVNDGKFHHILATRQADGSGRIYVDGVLENQQAAPPLTLVPAEVFVGADMRDHNHYLNAVIDEVKIYDRSLTPAEMAAMSNQPPVLTLLGNASVNAEAGSTYTDAGATAADHEDGDITASIVMAGSVDTSVLGNYTLTYNVKDSGGLSAQPVSRTVTVQDTTPPVLNVPADTLVEAFGDTTPAATGTATATDLFLNGVSYADTVVPGDIAQGVVSVISRVWTATDSSGNSTSATQTIKVVDTTAPVLSQPADILGVEATSAAGAVVTFALPTASDIVDASPAVTCSPASGSTFALHNTTVTCTATDASGNSSSKSFTVNVVDTTPPTVTAQLAQVGRDEDEVTFRVVFTASDLVDPNPVLTATLNGATVSNGQIVKLERSKRAEVENDHGRLQISGLNFTLNVSATDFSGNTGTASTSFAFPAHHEDHGIHRGNDKQDHHSDSGKHKSEGKAKVSKKSTKKSSKEKKRD